MISAPKNIYGPDVFKIFVYELGGPKRVSKMLDVTERTIRRWFADGSVPKMAVLALYWETRYGRSLIDTDHHAEVVLLRGHIQILEQQFVQATHIIHGLRALDYGTANEPLFDEKGEFNVRGLTPEQNAPIANDSERAQAVTVTDIGTPKLSAKDQARKVAMVKRQEATAHLSADEYAIRVLRSVRSRETRKKRLSVG